MLWTCDIAVMQQLFAGTGKTTDIPSDHVQFFQLYGPNIGTTEGDEWRMHRRVVTSAFTPGMNAAVWKETMSQTEMMLNKMLRDGGIVPVIKHWTSRLALHVINGVMYRKSLSWEESTEAVPAGHTMSYQRAMFGVVERLATLFMIPIGVLRRIPLKYFSDAGEAYDEWTKYIKEEMAKTVKELDSVAQKKYKTMMGE
jgi:cytochrome P450